GERQIGEEQTVHVPRGAHTIRLQLALTSDEYKIYRVLLHADDARHPTIRDGLKSRTTRGGERVVIAFFSSRDLMSGEYMLQVEGLGDAGRFEPISGYAFRVVQEAASSPEAAPRGVDRNRNRR